MPAKPRARGGRGRIERPDAWPVWKMRRAHFHFPPAFSSRRTARAEIAALREAMMRAEMDPVGIERHFVLADHRAVQEMVLFGLEDEIRGRGFCAASE